MIISSKLVIMVHSAHVFIVQYNRLWTLNWNADSIFLFPWYLLLNCWVTIGCRYCDSFIVLPCRTSQIFVLIGFTLPPFLHSLLHNRLQLLRKTLSVGSDSATSIQTWLIKIKEKVNTGKKSCRSKHAWMSWYRALSELIWHLLLVPSVLCSHACQYRLETWIWIHRLQQPAPILLCPSWLVFGAHTALVWSAPWMVSSLYPHSNLCWEYKQTERILWDCRWWVVPSQVCYTKEYMEEQVCCCQ